MPIGPASWTRGQTSLAGGREPGFRNAKCDCEGLVSDVIPDKPPTSGPLVSTVARRGRGVPFDSNCRAAPIRSGQFPVSQQNAGRGSEIILHQTEDGSTRLGVKLEDETVWLSLNQLAELFQRKRPAKRLYWDG